MGIPNDQLNFDIDELWKHMLQFRYRGTLTLKNLSNDLPTESWDAMYHTGLFLTIAALRLRRTRDNSIIKIIEETLDQSIEQGINFRGYNSEGEYWRDYMFRKYYKDWHNKDVFRDASRDAILALNFGLYWVWTSLEELKNDENYAGIFSRIKKIVNEHSEYMFNNNFDLKTTYGDCRSYEIPFMLLYKMIEPSIKLRPADYSHKIFKITAKLVPLWKTKKQYFTYDLVVMTYFLILGCYPRVKIDNENKSAEYIEIKKNYSPKMYEMVKKGFRKFLKSRRGDKNLFWELLYETTTGDKIADRDIIGNLNEIFAPFGDVSKKKIQDFIWQRHPDFRYHPRESWKEFYAPWHDLLIVYEINEYIKARETERN